MSRKERLGWILRMVFGETGDGTVTRMKDVPRLMKEAKEAAEVYDNAHQTAAIDKACEIGLIERVKP